MAVACITTQAEFDREREVSGSEEVADAVEIVWKVGNSFMDEKTV